MRIAGRQSASTILLTKLGAALGLGRLRDLLLSSLLQTGFRSEISRDLGRAYRAAWLIAESFRLLVLPWDSCDTSFLPRVEYVLSVSRTLASSNHLLKCGRVSLSEVLVEGHGLRLRLSRVVV